MTTDKWGISMDENKLQTFLAHLSNHKKLFWPAIEKNFQQNQALFKELAVPMLNWAATYLGDDYAKILSDGYVSFVTDVNLSQMRYEKQGHYQHKTYQEIFANVYDNPSRMSLYHWGVYVTTFAWEHHLKIYEFYKNNFISRLEPGGGTLLDLGSGSGIWSLLLLHLLEKWRVEGVDISTTSVALANEMSILNNFASRAKYIVGDALHHSASDKFEACLSCFLLEHLESPPELLINMSNHLQAGSYAFVTAALTAAEVDHIAEFKRESELIMLAEKAGFRVCATYSAAPRAYPTDYKFLPRSMALVLQKRRNDIW